MSNWRNITDEELSQLNLEEAKKLVIEMVNELPDEALPEVYVEIKRLCEGESESE